MNKENKARLLSKVAYEASVCVPAIAVLVTGTELFQDRPFLYKLGLVGITVGVCIASVIATYKIHNDALDRGFRVHRVWPEGDEPLFK